MFNCIESNALFGLCEGMGQRAYWIADSARSDSFCPDDVYIVAEGSPQNIKDGIPECAYRLSDYLLATAPVDVKEV